MHAFISHLIALMPSTSLSHTSCLNDLLPATARLTTAQVRYELMEAFEDVFPSMELCVHEKKGLPAEAGVEEVVLLEEEDREECV